VSVITGSENVFEDLGFESADEMLAEALLSHQIYKILKRRKLSQHQAAQLS
jgi:predicted XRE-type DNA-binding protein